jgi:hypothetical protein
MRTADINLPVDKVRKAVVQVVEEEGRSDSLVITYRAARVLVPDRTEDWPGEKFYGQVKRTLETMADEGAIRKVATRGGLYPNGHANWSTLASWYTIKEWDADMAKATQERAEADAAEARWTAVWDQLDAAGYPPSTGRGAEIRLCLEAWERLAATLEPLLLNGQTPDEAYRDEKGADL